MLNKDLQHLLHNSHFVHIILGLQLLAGVSFIICLLFSRVQITPPFKQIQTANSYKVEYEPTSIFIFSKTKPTVQNRGMLIKV